MKHSQTPAELRRRPANHSPSPHLDTNYKRSVMLHSGAALQIHLTRGKTFSFSYFLHLTSDRKTCKTSHRVSNSIQSLLTPVS